MLAIVNDFPRAWMLIGRSASAEIGAALEQCDVKAVFGKNRTGG